MVEELVFIMEWGDDIVGIDEVIPESVDFEHEENEELIWELLSFSSLIKSIIFKMKILISILQ